MSLLQILRENKEAIKLVELGALLHDLDKLEKEFLLNSSSHSLDSLYEKHKYKDKNDTVPVRKRRKWDEYKILFNKTVSFPYPFENIDSDKIPLTGNKTITIEQAFVYHHDNDPQEAMPLLGQIVHPALCGADGIDSELDKDKAVEDENHKKAMAIYSPFGKLEMLIDNFRHNAPQSSDMDTIKEIFSHALGETRFPCNDVTLWAHSYSVASLSKAIINKILLEYPQHPFNTGDKYKLPSRTPKGNGNPVDFTFFKVSFDRDYLLARAQKAGDICGIDAQVNEMQDKVRNIVENNILVGNEVYRDEENQVFLIPKLATWFENGKSILSEDLHQRFEKEIQAELEKDISSLLSMDNCHEFPFGIQFVNTEESDKKLADNAKTVTKRLLARSSWIMKEKTDCCQSVAALLSMKPEISENIGRCEVCGVRTIKYNGDHPEEKICAHCSRRRHNEKYLTRRNRREDLSTSDLEDLIDRKKGENKLVLISASFDLSGIHSGEIFEKVKWKNANKDASKNPSLARLHRSYETLEKFFADFLKLEVPKIASRGYFPITSSPKRLDFVVAANCAEEIIHKLHEEYEKNFGKFRESLPLNIACIFFYHKFPLYAVLEAERNLRKTFVAEERIWTVFENDKNGKIKVYDASKFSKIGDSAGYSEWNIPIDFTEGLRDDFHPVFGGKKAWELQKDDTIKAKEGGFDFVLIDSAPKRFVFTPKGLKHHIFRIRKSYPLSAITDFQRVGELIDELNENQAGIIEGLLVQKIQAWRDNWKPDSEVVKSFCQSVIMSPNAFGKQIRKKNADGSEKSYYSRLEEYADAVTLQDSNMNLLVRAAANGLLLDVIDLKNHLK